MTTPRVHLGAARRRALPLAVAMLMQGASMDLANPSTVGDLALPQLQRRLADLQAKTAGLLGGSDLLDDLHFGWFDRPYARTTLAVLVKTMSTLAREVHLRELGNAAISDRTVRAMLSWAEGALERVIAAPPDPGFRPHRLCAGPADMFAGPGAPTWFGFVDLATATRCDNRFGDLDLLTAMGFRVYAAPTARFVSPDPGSLLLRRADALGVTVLAGDRWRVLRVGNDLSTGDRQAIETPPLGRAVTLRELLERTLRQVLGEPGAVVVAGPVRPEALTGSLARVALARGVGMNGRFLMDGWMPPAVGGMRDAHHASATAAMWVYAIEGQSVGWLRGWRDLRDGSASAYPSVFMDPAYVETVAHTALDLLRFRDSVARLRGIAPLAIVIGPEAVDPRDGNAWAGWVEPVWSELLRRQIHYDLIPAARADEPRLRRDRVVVSLRRDDFDSVAGFLSSLDLVLAREPVHAQRVTVHESDGTLAADVFVRHVRVDGRRLGLVVVNLSSRARSLEPRGGSPLGKVKDLLSGTLVNTPRELLRFEPWQVRLLWPTGA